MSLTGFEKPLEQYNRDDIRKIAVLYGIPLSSIISQKLTKAQVIDAIRNNAKYQQKQRRPSDDKSNRIRPILNRLIGLEKPDDLMMEILKVLTITDMVPSPGKIYTFVYTAKTPMIQYDSHPLVAVTSVYRWGFSGVNFHWKQSRNYAWEEVVGSLHLVRAEELKDLREIPYAKILLNS
jgi:hypothetical protein